MVTLGTGFQRHGGAKVGRLMDGTGCNYIENHMNFLKRLSKNEVDYKLYFGEKIRMKYSLL